MEQVNHRSVVYVYVKFLKYEQVFASLLIPFTEKEKRELKKIEQQGWTERGICYAAARSFDKLMKYRKDDRFWSIFINEVKKWSLKKGDPRWEELNNRVSKRSPLPSLKDTLEKKEKQRKLEEEQNRKRNYLRSIFGKDIGYKDLNSFVYFIQGESGGAIKIGITQDIKKRIAGMQTGHPDTVIELAIIPGDTFMESYIHEMFKEYRLRGEWFKPSEAILVFIKMIKKTNFTVVAAGRVVRI
jgi:hypothetical protein